MADGEGEGTTFTQEELDAKVAEITRGLKENQQKAMDQVAELRGKLKGFEGIDPETYKTLVTAHEESQRKQAEEAGDFAAREKQLVEKHTKELDALKAELAEERGATERYLIDASATSALAEAKGSPKVLLPHIKAHTRIFRENGERVVQVVDERGNQRITDGKGTPMTIGDLIDELKADPDFARNFEGSGSSGGGASRSTGGAGGRHVVAADDNDAFIANLEAIAKGEVEVA